MRVLVLSETVMEQIRERAAAAKSKPISLERVKAGAQYEHFTAVLNLEDRKPDLERPPSECVEIPMGYRACYSVEEQPPGLYGHLSVSVETPGMLPNAYAIEAIAAAFGLHKVEAKWLEEFSPGHHAVNLLGPLEKTH